MVVGLLRVGTASTLVSPIRSRLWPASARCAHEQHGCWPDWSRYRPGNNQDHRAVFVWGDRAVSERGVFAVDRGVWDHPSFANEPFTQREAWIWLIGEAAFKVRTKRIGSVTVELARAQVAASTRFMADKWGWSESRVRRFLKRLEADAMIDIATDAGVTVLTIRNYNKYQRVSLPSDAVSDAHSDAAATQRRRKLEGKENKEDISVPNGTGAGAPIYTDSRHELWGEGVPILISLGVPERQARSMIGSWLKLTKDDAQAVLGAIQRARDHRAHNPIPWITNALKGQPNEHNSSAFSYSSANKPGSPAILAGVAAAADRRAREQSAVGRQRPASGNACASAEPDPELFGEAGGSRAH
jgi:hypothetical protein